MKTKLTIMIMILSLTSSLLIAQDTNSLVESYLDNFNISPADMKLQILKEVNERDEPDLIEVVENAVKFILSSSRQVQGSYVFQQMVLYSSKIIQKDKIYEAPLEITLLFDLYTATTIRVELLKALYVVGKDDPRVVEWLNLWLSSQNNLQKDGIPVNQQVVAAAIDVLGLWTFPDSFYELFQAYSIQYSTIISEHANDAMLQYQDDFTDRMIALLPDLSAEEHEAAQEYIFNGDLSDESKGRFAAESLAAALVNTTGNLSDEIILRDLRHQAVSIITQLEYADATDQMIGNFNMSLLEFDRGTGRKYNLLEAIAGLGVVEPQAAGKRLTEYLDLITDYSVETLYDEQIVYSVINNLASLNYSEAKESILNVTVLPFSNGLIARAEEIVMNF